MILFFSGKRRDCWKLALCFSGGARGLARAPRCTLARSFLYSHLGARWPGAAHPAAVGAPPALGTHRRVRGRRLLCASCGKHASLSWGENLETEVWGAPGSGGACPRESWATAENAVLPGS